MKTQQNRTASDNTDTLLAVECSGERAVDRQIEWYAARYLGWEVCGFSIVALARVEPDNPLPADRWGLGYREVHDAADNGAEFFRVLVGTDEYGSREYVGDCETRDEAHALIEAIRKVVKRFHVGSWGANAKIYDAWASWDTTRELWRLFADSELSEGIGEVDHLDYVLPLLVQQAQRDAEESVEEASP
jgi:hypothetical protein